MSMIDCMDEWECNYDIGDNIEILNEHDKIDAAIPGDIPPSQDADNEYIDLYVEDIIKKNPSMLPVNVTIQYECALAYFFQVLLENILQGTNKIGDLNDKVPNIIKYLEWISLASGHLCEVAGQCQMDCVQHFSDTITRSSYNFCKMFTQCKKFYNKNEEPTCREHHYVHCLVKNDIDSVINFIRKRYRVDVEDNNPPNIELTDTEANNLYLSIKTISYVTRHMSKEINYIKFVSGNNVELFHRNNPAIFKKNAGYERYSTVTGHKKDDVSGQSDQQLISKGNTLVRKSNDESNNFRKKRGGGRQFNRPVSSTPININSTTNPYECLSNYNGNN
jgi:hypothetical protein